MNEEKDVTEYAEGGARPKAGKMPSLLEEI